LALYISWHLNFDLRAVNDGGLEISGDDDAKPVCTTTYTFSNEGAYWSDDWASYAQSVSNHINDKFANYLGQTYNDLLGALEKQHKLFLPAGGVFLAKNPLFNERGDLMTALHYNG
jgi:hypothetical protein